MKKMHFPHLKRIWLILAILVIIVFSISRLCTLESNDENLTQSFSKKDIVGKGFYYNLLDPDSDDAVLHNVPCNQDYANQNKLQQDHPCVIQLIRRNYLHRPSPPEVPLDLKYPGVVDPSAGQSSVILPYLKNKTDGFFVECGALDGEYQSNTLYMERSLKWSGVLIEANQELFSELLTRNRKAYALPVCLSLRPYPTEVLFHEDDVAGKIHAEHIKDSNDLNNLEGFVKRQCFPFYSILLAVGRIHVDYFSVDVEGSESLILKTIPWHRVDIQTLTVEVTSRKASDVDALTQFMEGKGYEKKKLMDGGGFFDLVFLKKSLQNEVSFLP